MSWKKCEYKYIYRIQTFIHVCFYVFSIVDNDSNPSTKVTRNGTTSSDIENVKTVEVNNKNEIYRYGRC